MLVKEVILNTSCNTNVLAALLLKMFLIILTDKKLYCHYVNARTLVMVSSAEAKSIKLTTKDENKLEKIVERKK